MKTVNDLYECRECGVITSRNGVACPNCSYTGETEKREVYTLGGDGDTAVEEVQHSWNESISIKRL